MGSSPISFGDYVITRRIARGGMAEIFRARAMGEQAPQLADGAASDRDPRWLALKMMRSELGNHELRQKLFEREAKIVAALRHPNVVPIFEYGENEGRHFLAMEYISGKNLAQMTAGIGLKREKRALPLELCTYIGIEASAGLGHAHHLSDKAGHPMEIVHRDISPGNIMVSFDGRVKILDFGVARMSETNGIHTQTGTLRGKFAYMSPEQTLGSNVDARSDVFALGIVLYELLTGDNPFRGDSPIATLDRVQRHRPAPPSQVRRELPPAINKVLARCLAKDPRRRYRDGTELHEALLDFALDYPAAKPHDAARYLSIHFKQDQWREESQLQTELEQVAAVEILDFRLSGSQEQDAVSDPDLIHAAAIEEASHAEVLAAVSSLLDREPEAPEASEQVKTLRYIAANVQEPLDDEPETALATVFDQNFTSSDLIAAADEEDHMGVPTEAQVPIAQKQNFGSLRKWALATLVVSMSIFAVLGFRAVDRPAKKTEREKPQKRAQTVKKPKPLPITTIEPVTIDIPLPVRTQNRRAKEIRRKVKRVQAKKPAETRVKSYGYLNVGAKPWGYIEINGKRRKGRTPQTDIRLSTGIHGVRVINPNTKVQRKVRVEIQEGKYKTLTFDLRMP